VSEGLLVAAFCGGTRVLAAAGVINGVRVVGHPLYEQEYVDAGGIYVPDAVPPLVDGNIMTSRRGQYYAYEIYETMDAAIDSLRTAKVR
jgi:putative intracellular protease/amidase